MRQRVPDKKKASGCLAEQPGGPTTIQSTFSGANFIYFKEFCQATFTSAIQFVNTFFNLSARAGQQFLLGVCSREGREI